MSLSTSVAALIGIIKSLVQFPTAKRGDFLYIDNLAGNFSFDYAPALESIGVVTSQAEFDHSDTAIRGSSQPGRLYDTRTDTLYTWDGTTMSNTGVARDQVFTKGRMYASPYTQKVYLYEATGDLTQLRGQS